jgi:glycosyltransferase involved in cell wall biosynthesis
MHVVRNVPSQPRQPWKSQRSKLGLDENQKYVILQGAYIDPDRGAEELVMAAQLTTKFQVIVAGSGRAMEKLKSLDLGNKVLFKPRMPYDELMAYTASCDLGVSLDKPLHDNYTYSLPNKLFDYWQAGLPVLVSPVVEVKRLVESELTGQVIESWSPEYLVQKIEGMLSSSQLVEWKSNAIKAAQLHCWEKESEVIRRQIRPFGLPK